MPAPRPYDAGEVGARAPPATAAVLATCRELLFRDGHHQMTVRSLAEQAEGVARDGLQGLRQQGGANEGAVGRDAGRSDDQPVTIADRLEMQEVRFAADPAEESCAGGPGSSAAPTSGWRRCTTCSPRASPEVTQLLATTQQERLTGVRALVTHLFDSGLLAPGLDQATAADACWALTGPRLYLDLTTDRGWPPDRYETWLTRMLTANLITPGASAVADSVQPLG